MKTYVLLTFICLLLVPTFAFASGIPVVSLGGLVNYGLEHPLMAILVVLGASYSVYIAYPTLKRFSKYIVKISDGKSESK